MRAQSSVEAIQNRPRVSRTPQKIKPPIIIPKNFKIQVGSLDSDSSKTP
jgi:hypothetical protein